MAPGGSRLLRAVLGLSAVALLQHLLTSPLADLRAEGERPAISPPPVAHSSPPVAPRVTPPDPPAPTAGSPPAPPAPPPAAAPGPLVAVWNGLPAHLFQTDFAPLNNFVRWVAAQGTVRLQLQTCPLVVECPAPALMAKSAGASIFVVFTHFFRVKYADRLVRHIREATNATGVRRIVYFLAGDEYCTNVDRDFPTPVVFSCYFHQQLPHRPQVTFHYVPLGVGFKFPAALAAAPPPAPARRFLFNCIVTLETSPTRRALAGIVRALNASLGRPLFLHLIPRWSKTHDRGYLTPVEYQRTLRDSLFTLVPAGHSPECYRLFEALESGSIPVVVDHPGTFRPRCGDPWRELRASGLVAFLRSWDALPAFMEGVVRDPAPAHAQQRAVTAGFAALKDRLYRPLMDALLA